MTHEELAIHLRYKKHDHLMRLLKERIERNTKAEEGEGRRLQEVDCDTTVLSEGEAGPLFRPN